jgi:hypothetical protein
VWVDGGRAEESVGERVSPLRKIKIAGDKGGCALMAFGNKVVQVLVLGRPEWLEPQIIDDQQRHPDQGLEATLKDAHGASCVQPVEQLRLGCKQNLMPLSHGTMAERLGEMALACAAGAGDEVIGRFF